MFIVNVSVNLCSASLIVKISNAGYASIRYKQKRLQNDLSEGVFADGLLSCYLRHVLRQRTDQPKKANVPDR